MRKKTVIIFLILSALIAGAAYLLLSLRPPPLNLIIVSLDGLRPDRLGAYGCATVNSPNLDSFARSAYVFEDAISQSPRVLPSHLSLFTSLYPSTHGVERPDLTLHPDIPTLAEILKRNGRRTAAVVDSPAMDRPSGISRGFDAYYNNYGWGIHHVLPQALRWLRYSSDRPFFLFIHISDIRCPYTPLSHISRLYRADHPEPINWSVACGSDNLQPDLSPDDLAYVRRQYDGQVRSVDLILQRLFDHIDKLELRRNTIVIVLAGRGEELLEHGRIGHRDSVYHELLRVPLIVRLPGDVPPAGRIPERVELIDLMPTLLDLLGIADPAGLQGESFRPLLEGRRAGWTEKPAFGELDGGGKRTVYMSGLKLIVNAEGAGEELYQLDRDPGEKQNLAGEVVAPGLRVLLADWEKRTRRAGENVRPGRSPLSPQQREAFRNLGYAN
jgi:arylsulfatase A-like enzyme